jgi:3-oxoacyl-[acyl-carrier-protein] synthase III
MISSVFTNIKIVGIEAVVPTKIVDAHAYDPIFGAETVEKIISVTGVKTTYHAFPEQTSSDLGFTAAKKLMNVFNIDPSTIGVLIFTAAYLDYFVPPTACVLHNRLGLSQDCIAYDINLACSGYVYALQTMCATLHTSNATRGLLITGDITSKIVSPLDKSRMLFGDGGTATLVEKCNDSEPIRFGLKTDGSRFKDIIVPAGAFRNVGVSHERTLWADGNTRSDYDLYMNGTDVFNFTMTDVPKLVKEFMEYYDDKIENYDNIIFHQPNYFILKHLLKKLKASPDKMPISLDRYGNTSVCSIPLTICDAYGGKSKGIQRLFLYGFGVGLSWAIATLTLDTNSVLPIFHTDDHYTEGTVSHG